jgi:hypothetical protein
MIAQSNVHWKCILCIFLTIFLLSSITTFSQKVIGFSLLDGKRESKISFELIGNLIVVPIRLNNGKMTKAVVDTGIRSVVLYGRKFRNNLDFTNTRNIRINGLGKGKRQEGKLAINNTLRIGDVVGKGVGLVSVDTEMPFQILNENGVEAIMGYQLFINFIIEIDYINHEITFRDPSSFLPNPNARHLDLEVDYSKPYTTTTIKIKDRQSEIHACKMKLLIDTGAGLDMMIYSRSKNAKLFMSKKSGKVRIGQGVNGDIQGIVAEKMKMNIGQFELSEVEVSFSDRKSNRKHSRYFGVDGLIGGNILKRYKVTFDYIHGVVYFEQPNLQIRSASL